MIDDSSASNSVQENDQISEPSTSFTSINTKSFEEQMDNLKSIINSLRDEIERKEHGLSRLAKDNEKLNLELLKQKKCNSNILKQLEDERKFYFQEKEIYCQEMNEIKELKKNMSKSRNSSKERPVQELKDELDNTKMKLKETLEANYNLSIKFLRIKNTKAFLRNELTKIRNDHEKVFNDLKLKIAMMSSDIQNITNTKFNLNDSPSNRKYIQLVRQNGLLVHENLALQLEIERLNTQFDQIKLKYTKSETNKRLKYIHPIKSDSESQTQNERNLSGKDRKRVRITTEDKAVMIDQEKLDLKSKCQSEVIKIYERSESEDAPSIQIIGEDEVEKPRTRSRSRRKCHKKTCRKYKQMLAASRDLEKDEVREPPTATVLASITETEENVKNS